LTVTKRGVSTISSSSGTSQSINKVTGTTAGDLMFMLVGIGNADNRVLAIPDGWAVWPRTAYIPNQGPCMLLWRIAGNSEPSSYTITYSLSAVSNLAIISYYSNAALGIKVEDIQAQYNGVLDFTFPSATFISSAGVHVCFGFGETSAAAPSTGYTEEFDGDSSYRLYCQTKVISASGATGSKATTGIDQDNVGISLALVEGTFVIPHGPSHRETTSTGPSTVTSTTVAAPTNLKVGDLMVLEVGFSGTDSTPSVSGWSTPTNGSLTGSTGAYLFTKTAVNADIGSTISITWGGASRTVLVRCAAFFSPRGDVLTVDDCQQLAETSQNLNFPAATATDTNEYWLRLSNSSNTLTGSQTTGAQVYRIADSGAGPRQVWLGSVVAASGSTGTDQTTRSSSGGNVNKSWSLLIREVPVPGDPSSLNAVATSDSAIGLSWTDTASNEDSYKIEHSTDGSSWSLLDTIAANSTTYSHTGLSEHSTHYYRVYAYNNISGASGYSNTSNATTSIKAPTSLTATGVSSTQIDLAWTNPSGVEDGTKVEQSSNGLSGWVVIATKAANSTSHSVTGLTPGVIQYFRVRNYVGSDFSAYSNTANATPVLTAPSGLTATKLSLRRVRLDWTNASAEESGTEIYQSLDSLTGFALVATVAADVLTYTVSALEPATTYFWKIRNFKN